MDSMDTFREQFEALEQRTNAMATQTRTLARRLRWWQGVASRLLELRLSGGRSGSSAPIMRCSYGLRALWVMGMILGWIAVGAAGEKINCGDILGPGGVFELKADLHCGETSPALTVRDGAQLELGGHIATPQMGSW